MVRFTRILVAVSLIGSCIHSSLFAQDVTDLSPVEQPRLSLFPAVDLTKIEVPRVRNSFGELPNRATIILEYPDGTKAELNTSGRLVSLSEFRTDGKGNELPPLFDHRFTKGEQRISQTTPEPLDRDKLLGKWVAVTGMRFGEAKIAGPAVLTFKDDNAYTESQFVNSTDTKVRTFRIDGDKVFLTGTSEERKERDRWSRKFAEAREAERTARTEGRTLVVNINPPKDLFFDTYAWLRNGRLYRQDIHGVTVYVRFREGF